MNSQEWKKCELHLTERKTGVLECANLFPECVEKYIEVLSLYRASQSLPKARICFAHDTHQDMLMMCCKGHVIDPHCQEGRTIEYEIIRGECTLFLFDNTLNVLEVHPLCEGDNIELSSAIPRTMAYESDLVVFREKLSGSFDDSDTKWLKGNGLKSIDNNTLRMMKLEYSAGEHNV